jgi:hypothetical protein
MKVILNRELKACPVFSNLKTLSLGEWCMAADFDPLVFFLQHSPNLERLFLELKLVCISRHPMNICWCGFCHVPLIKLLFCEKCDDPEEEMEDRTRLAGRSFVCTHVKMVKIKCSEYEIRVHSLAELFKANGVPVEKIYVRRQITCESYILFYSCLLGISIVSQSCC